MKRYIETWETVDYIRGLFYFMMIFLTGRGGSNLYGRMLRKTAPPLLHEKSEIKRVIKEAPKSNAYKIK
jgi:hypothetical protein